MLKHSVCQCPYDPKSHFKYAYKWKVSTSRLSSDIVDKVWSGSVFKGNHRCDDDWIFSDWCVLDFDAGTTLEQATEELFPDYLHIIATTKSHSQTQHKFRVAIPWEDRISEREVFWGNMDQVVERYDADPRCRSLSHSFAPCRKIVSINRDPESYRMEVDTTRRRKQVPPWDGTPQPLSRFALKMLHPANVVEKGRRDSVAFGVAKDLLKTGMRLNDVFENLKNIKFNPPLHERLLRNKVDAAVKHLSREKNRG